MAIRQTDLRNAAYRSRGLQARSLNEARTLRLKTAFLCHSHNDRDLVSGLIQLLGEAGLRIYVDWEDNEMPSTPNRITAQRIQGKIKSLDLFLFLTTASSMASRWCPWEIGYADCAKPIESILIVPTSDDFTTHGSEYLDLYSRIDRSTVGDLRIWNPGTFSNGRLLRDLL